MEKSIKTVLSVLLVPITVKLFGFDGIFESKGTAYRKNQKSQIAHGVKKKVAHHEREETFDVELWCDTLSQGERKCAEYLAVNRYRSEIWTGQTQSV